MLEFQDISAHYPSYNAHKFRTHSYDEDALAFAHKQVLLFKLFDDFYNFSIIIIKFSIIQSKK